MKTLQRRIGARGVQEFRQLIEHMDTVTDAEIVEDGEATSGA